MNDSITGLPVLTHPPGSLSKAWVCKTDPAGRAVEGTLRGQPCLGAAPLDTHSKCWQGWCVGGGVHTAGLKA